MIIVEIIDVSKTKCKLILDNEIAFVLYKGDLFKYDFHINTQIDEKTWNYLHDEVFFNRAKERSMKLLADRSYSEYLLREKLKNDGYLEDVIERTIAYVAGYGYLNDHMYTRSYIEYHSLKKSKRQILMELAKKGIPKSQAEEIWEELCQEERIVDECENIRKLLIKKHYNNEDASYEQMEKMIHYLLAKGFEMDSIKKCMKEF